MSFGEILRREFQTLGLQISTHSLQQLALYAEEIEHWNRAVNLTALSGSALIRRLIVDPVWVGQHLHMDGVVCDVGSGNGSPGIPLSITGKFSSTNLIEPRMKRAAFLRHVIAKLKLTNVVVHRSRIEDIPEKTLRSDWITLQAIDPTPVLKEYLRKIAIETTRVVWITSIVKPPVPDAEKLEIPGSSTKIWVFRLDQT
ncbi:MAG TPA: 16S rRNA (guanine(527)-N(7))-methyltransferase RsmG [Terriglobia bacterium]|nr:16S rRNA (guanine(527)-N(7))-methyltransferase RsmG [Terriglobia bacterium]